MSMRQGFGDQGVFDCFFHKGISLGAMGKKGDEARHENAGGEGSRVIT